MFQVQTNYVIAFSTLQSTLPLVYEYFTVECWSISASVYCRLMFAVLLHYKAYITNLEPGVLSQGIHLHVLWGPIVTYDDCMGDPPGHNFTGGGGRSSLHGWDPSDQNFTAKTGYGDSVLRRPFGCATAGIGDRFFAPWCPE